MALQNAIGKQRECLRTGRHSFPLLSSLKRDHRALWRRQLSTAAESDSVIQETATTGPPPKQPMIVRFEDAFPVEDGGMRVKYTPIEYQARLNMIDACLRSGQIPRAHMLFRKLTTTYPLLTRKLVDVHVHNSFLEAFVENEGQLSLREALQWFNGMRKDHGIQPNLTSYAIMISGALKMGRDDIIRALVQDMKRTLMAQNNSISASALELELLRSPHIGEQDAQHVAKVLGHRIPREPSTEETGAEDILGSEINLTSVRRIARNLPEVKSSSGPLLPFIKRNLKTLDDPKNAFRTAFDLQMNLEEESCRLGLERLLNVREEVLKKTGASMIAGDVRQLMNTWHTHLTPLVVSDIEQRCSNTSGLMPSFNDETDFGPFMLLFRQEPRILAAITVSQVLREFSTMPEHVPAHRLVANIGAAVEHEFKNGILKKPRFRNKLRQDYLEHQRLVESKEIYDVDQRKSLASDLDTFGKLLHTQSWSPEVKTSIGSHLMSMLMRVAQVPVPKELPGQIQFPKPKKMGHSIKSQQAEDIVWEQALQHDIIFRSGKKLGVFKLHDAVAAKLGSGLSANIGGSPNSAMITGLLPMVIRPQPWLNYDRGGYLTIKSVCVRGMTGEIEAYMKEGSIQQTLSRLYAGLDALGATGWRINDTVLKHLIHAWNNGLVIGKLPKDVPDHWVDPPFPQNYETDEEVRRMYWRETRKIKQLYYDAKGLRATENYKLEIARAFSGMTIYFPHNVDFRGRAYPIPPNLNHLGNDISRALLVFDKEKPLGPQGLRWLKIHLANVYGNDKLTFDERERFIDDNLDKVLASADDPFGVNEETNGWWKNADKPWLCLGIASDIANALRSKNPEEYLSRMPVHQDGSCNGLQHYAALGGDVAGARQVNLYPGLDRPQDVYTAVAVRVRELVAKDLSYQPSKEEMIEVEEKWNTSDSIHDSPAFRHKLATMFPPEKIERKTVKQTVMTTVYGVTAIGARDQVRARLREKYPDVYSDSEMNRIAGYIAPKIFTALSDMFHSARKIQDWLAFSAGEIARSVKREDLLKSKKMLTKYREIRKKAQAQGLKTVKQERQNVGLNSNSSVVWTTPLDFVVVQPYRATKTYTVKTATQSYQFRHTHVRVPVDVVKQRAAFPPNFIHSLDATHMLMTAISCSNREDPITFASVHDSYWTHACDVERLRVALKEEFVNLHSQPIMENLKDEFQTRYEDRVVQKLVPVEEADTDISAQEKFLDDEIVDAETVMKEQEVTMIKPNAETSGESDITAIVDAGDHLEVVEEDITPRSTDADPIAPRPIRPRKGQKFIRRWVPLRFPPLPPRGDFDIRDVAKSEYFFS